MSTERNIAFQKFILTIFVSLILFPTIAFAAVNEREASQAAKSKYHAKVLAIKTINKAGIKHFKIKLLLDNGRIKTVYINSKNGEISDRAP